MATDINTTWLGIVGPGVKHLGVNGDIWSDHTDTRPTMLSLVGLKDDYTHDGRFLFEIFEDSALSQSLQAHHDTLTRLADVYKQINAPVGKLGLTTLQVSTTALESNAPGDSTYISLENQLASINNMRDAVAGHMIAILEAAEFGGGNGQAPTSALVNGLINQANVLLARASAL